MFIFSIIGIISCIWFVVLLLANLFIYISYKLNHNSEYAFITRDTCFFEEIENDFILIPSIKFYFGLGKHYPSFTISWLKWCFELCYHIKTDEEEEAITEARNLMEVK